jgi:hypothetical protein
MGNTSCKKGCKCSGVALNVALVYADPPTDAECVDMAGLGLRTEEKLALGGGSIGPFTEGEPQKPGYGFNDARGGVPTISEQRLFEVTLLRSGEHWKSIGLIVLTDDNVKQLLVDRVVEPSLISQWNKHNSEYKKVRAGDHIVSVNSIQGDGDVMLEELRGTRKGSVVTLMVEGPPSSLDKVISSHLQSRDVSKDAQSPSPDNYNYKPRAEAAGRKGSPRPGRKGSPRPQNRSPRPQNLFPESDFQEVSYNSNTRSQRQQRSAAAGRT